MPIWGWSLALLAMLGVALLVMVWVRRRIRSAIDQTGQDFTLSDLRKLRASGEIDQEQYEKLRTAIIGASRKPDSAGSDRMV